MSLRPAIAIALALAVAPAFAETPVALLFETPHVAALATGDVVRYRHSRSAPEGLGMPAAADMATLEKRADRAMTLTLDAEGRGREIAFDDLPGNPLVMVVLENAVRATSRATGGSPFYLRNRVREALRDDLARRDGALVARPFADDPNRARLGAFADLELRFVMDPDAPGMFRSLGARAADGAYAEEFRLDDAP